MISCKKVVFLLLLLPGTLFSQKNWKEKIINQKISKQSERFNNNLDFKKTLSFYLEREWDSTLIYTAKLISKESAKELLDYCSFFRGYSFQQKKIFTEAEKEFNKTPKDFYLYPMARMYLGEIALEQQKFQKAIEYFDELKNLDVEGLFGTKRSVIDHNIGVSYLHLEKFGEAEAYLLKSVKAQEKEKDTIHLVGGYGDLANVYYEQYKDAQAIPYFQKAYQLAKKVKNFKLKQNTALNMAVVEENRKDLVKALKYRKEYEQWRDSVNNQDRIYETAQMEKKIAVEQKQKEVISLQAENRIKEAQRNGFLYSAIILLLLLGTVFYFYREKVKTNRIISDQKEQLNELNTTKDKLFSVVSHDLRSSVNAIKTGNKKLLENLETQDKKEITKTLQQNSSIVNGAYRLLDNLLNWALLQTKQSYFEMTQLSLSRIIDHVAYNYKPILQEKEITYTNSISKKEEAFADQESLKIITRNLLDNAIKFTEEGGEISIYSENKENYINLIVEDSGIGMDKETQEELQKDTQLLSKKKHENIIGTGLGLHLVKSMTAKNQGKFNIESEVGKGTKIIISLLKSPNHGAS